MNQPFIKLFRGHKDGDFLKTRRIAPCFSEDKALATSYGKGNNDESNADTQNGYVTSVEFFGHITFIEKNGLDLFKDNNEITRLKRSYDAVRCKDRVIIVFNFDKLKNPMRELAL